MKFSYVVLNIYKLSFKIKDQSGKPATIQTSVKVSVTVTAVNNTDSSTKQNNIVEKLALSLSGVPMPLYVVALAVTFGFGGGDLYDRKYDRRSPTVINVGRFNILH